MDAGTLRLWILVVGLGVVAGIYGWAKFQERRARRSDRVEPEIGSLHGAADDDWAIIPVLTERLHAEPGSASVPREPSVGEGSPERAAPRKPAAPEAPPKELILTLTVLAPRSRQFRGGSLAKALHQAGMVYGDMRIFHAPADLEQPDGPVLFSLANVVEPGTLEPERLRLLETPGVVLFAQLPGPVRGLEVFEHMISTGRFLARELGGELCDGARHQLTFEKAEEIRTRIRAEIGDTVRKPDF